MKMHTVPRLAKPLPRLIAALVFASVSGNVALAAETAVGAKTIAAAPAAGDKLVVAVAAPSGANVQLSPQNAVYVGPTEIATPLRLIAGKTAVIRLPADAIRLSVGNPDVADVMLINPREVYVLGKKIGSTNLFVWTKDGRTTIMDVGVGLDTGTLKDKLKEFLPSESGVKVDSLADSIVLSGRISDPVRVHRLVALTEIYSGGKKVINLMSVEGSQQVMLEVKIAEVSKPLLDKLGVGINATRGIGGGATIGLLAGLLSGGAGAVTLTDGATRITLDAEIRKGLVKILAEPTIMAVSGQEGAFLAGGKIFIPVPQSGSSGATVITLEEKEFGVGLRFTPTVLEDGLINLRVTPEVSELSQVGTTVTAFGGASSVLPSISTRRASTTVQLRDGESFAIGGLIKNNVTEVIKALPILGELPILGALFRSSEFQTDRSELVFIVTPRLVKPLPPNYALPTDSFNEPERTGFFLEGRMEGESKPGAPQPATQPGAQGGGFQVK